MWSISVIIFASESRNTGCQQPESNVKAKSKSKIKTEKPRFRIGLLPTGRARWKEAILNLNIIFVGSFFYIEILGMAGSSSVCIPCEGKRMSLKTYSNVLCKYFQHGPVCTHRKGIRIASRTPFDPVIQCRALENFLVVCKEEICLNILASLL